MAKFFSELLLGITTWDDVFNPKKARIRREAERAEMNAMARESLGPLADEMDEAFELLVARRKMEEGH